MNDAEATGYSMVLTTARSDNTQDIVQALLAQQLAACVQVMPIRSHYVWQGAMREESEDLLLIKSRTEDYTMIEATIRAVHHYDTPEILRFDVAAGARSYLDWIGEMTARRG
ncbi:MAG: periplasmic divalent cation tolerance protein cutA [Hyphomicrobiales bacterium]|jgi:periplasmic divalent cation tolerance protein|nr:periplasmic divalent cation tolerance protein cutA [Hyphomicrobiales bacterium]